MILPLSSPKKALFMKWWQKIPRSKISHHFSFYKNWRFVGVVVFGYIFLFLCYDINVIAGKVATRFAGPPIPDTLFDFLPKMNTSFIHDTLSTGFFYTRNFLLLLFPTRILFAIFSLGTLTLTRALFINMTHLGIPDGAHPIMSGGTFGGDLFFSGHVAYPFLLALVFWDIRFLRFSFLALTFLFGASSILGRYHYTIDVFAAPFITYGVYILCKKLFEFLHLTPFPQKNNGGLHSENHR